MKISLLSDAVAFEMSPCNIAILGRASTLVVGGGEPVKSEDPCPHLGTGNPRGD